MSRIGRYDQAFTQLTADVELTPDSSSLHNKYLRIVELQPVPGLQPAKKILSAPPTSVTSEQLFSAADCRSNLVSENTKKLLFLAPNFLMQSSSGLINIHELRWLGDWLVVLAGGRGRQAGP